MPNDRCDADTSCWWTPAVEIELPFVKLKDIRKGEEDRFLLQRRFVSFCRFHSGTYIRPKCSCFPDYSTPDAPSLDLNPECKQHGYIDTP